ncbi:hypothetical protein [Tropicimonas sp. IMCC6043]|uniref:hypothetical protein n=1 Tax=Tropicimonas sp. IMCC6043 TaxID=2510645 RepID=UPI0013EE2385|nr:hypothetical protein [Tropicimonas sp. IMCC6043]
MKVSWVAGTVPDVPNEPMEIRIVYQEPDGTMRDQKGNVVEEDAPGIIAIDGRL